MGHRSVALVRQKFAGHGDTHAVTFRVLLALDLHIEVDRAHSSQQHVLEKLFEIVMIDIQTGVRRGFRSRRPSRWDYISSSTVVAMVMRVPWSVPVICIGELKEVS